jgi:wobble nucleotide-excising tRNase
MLQQVTISNIATFPAQPTVIDSLKEIVFIYGSNGTGKSTIGRVLKNPDHYPNCELKFKNNQPCEVIAYNQDFKSKTFSQSATVPGIFTYGENNVEAEKEINALQTDINNKTNNVTAKQRILQGSEGKMGLKRELEEALNQRKEDIWRKSRATYTEFKLAFPGLGNNKELFTNKLIEESKTIIGPAVPLDEIKSEYESIFTSIQQKFEKIDVSIKESPITQNIKDLLANPIVARSSSQIGQFFNKIKNADWVVQGISFLEKAEGDCPFCGQNLPEGLKSEIENVFDTVYNDAIAELQVATSSALNVYTSITEEIEQLLLEESQFIDLEKLKSIKKQILEERRRYQLLFQSKLESPSANVEVELEESAIIDLKRTIEAANIKIERHNSNVDNHDKAKATITRKIWELLLRADCGTALEIHGKVIFEKQKIIAKIEDDISVLQKNLGDLKENLKKVESQITSIAPTVEVINRMLKRFGFEGFSIAPFGDDLHYKIVRTNGEPVHATLSEGESSFLSFLYFYHFVSGSHESTGTQTKRVVVIDDPVSSLDSNVLFIVSTLVKDLFNRANKPDDNVSQVILLTHNTYFWIEASFANSGNPPENSIFFILRKDSEITRVKKYTRQPIKSTYGMLWDEIKSDERSSPALQNIMRRILEQYFNTMGGVKNQNIYDKFSGEDLTICHALYSWINKGSHCLDDTCDYSLDAEEASKYKRVFKQIFINTDQEGHYNLMMERPAFNENVIEQGAAVQD